MGGAKKSEEMNKEGASKMSQEPKENNKKVNIVTSKIETADKEKKEIASTKTEVSEAVPNDKKDEAQKELITTSVAAINKEEVKGDESTAKPKKEKMTELMEKNEKWKKRVDSFSEDKNEVQESKPQTPKNDESAAKQPKP